MLPIAYTQEQSANGLDDKQKVHKLLADTALVGGMKPAVRWYDARQRCALRLLATWLKVPWKMVVNFECLLVYRLLLPPEEASKAKSTPWDQGMRAAKIGAASLGIGAIFAVTGDSSTMNYSSICLANAGLLLNMQYLDGLAIKSQ